MSALKIFSKIFKNKKLFNNNNIYFITNDKINKIDFYYLKNNKIKAIKYSYINNKILFHPIKNTTTDKKWLKLFTTRLINNSNSKLGLCIKEFHSKKFIKSYNNNEHYLILNALINIFEDYIDEKQVGYKKL